MDKSFSLLDLMTLAALGGLIIHLWGVNQNLSADNEALRYQLQQFQAEMRGLERGVVISK